MMRTRIAAITYWAIASNLYNLLRYDSLDLTSLLHWFKNLKRKYCPGPYIARMIAMNNKRPQIDANCSFNISEKVENVMSTIRAIITIGITTETEMSLLLRYARIDGLGLALVAFLERRELPSTSVLGKLTKMIRVAAAHKVTA
jgi:hypothetical protein